MSERNERINWMRIKLRPHVGHKLACVYYGDPEDPADVCAECETCNCVLVSAEDFDEINLGNEVSKDGR